MSKKFIAGGCSFTFGNELSDDDGKTPSRHTWAYGINQTQPDSGDYICVAKGGLGNQAIARTVFKAIDLHRGADCVVVMWSFLSRYDWAMPRHRLLEDTRWASISPWDTSMNDAERHNALVGSEIQLKEWEIRNANAIETGVRPFAESLYKHAANQYHEIYLSWKSIVWLQNILEKKKIPFMFTLADNSLFYQEMQHHKETDSLLNAMHSEIDLSKWFFFGERCMGFNQWSLLNDYERATTHPLDKAHKDAIILMKPEFDKIIGGQK